MVTSIVVSQIEDVKMAKLEIKNITKKFGDFYAANNITFTAEEGEFVTLLGPSGCGKTSLLKLIAGFHVADEGEILIGGKNVNNVPPEKRNTAMCFQSYALFPHLNVSHNICYGLKQRKIDIEEQKQRLNLALKQMDLEFHKLKLPNELSGGQQQRVALARAMVTRPDVILFDEPLSNLDAKLRESVRFEIKQLSKQYNLTSIYVTHDQAEALTMSDKIIVLNKGAIEQIGSPQDIYHHPKNRFVADFIGIANITEANVKNIGDNLYAVSSIFGNFTVFSEKKPESERIYICFRPEDIELLPNAQTEAENQILGVRKMKSLKNDVKAWLLLCSGLGTILFLMGSTFYIVVSQSLGLYSMGGEESQFSLEYWQAVLNSPVFQNSYIYSVKVSLLGAILSIIVAYPIAMWLRKKLPAKVTIITILRAPMLVPGLVAAFLFVNMISYHGILNEVFVYLGIWDEPKTLQNDEFGWGVVILQMWKNIPFALILIGGAVNSLKTDLLDAAANLGSSPWQRFRYVIFPLTLGAVQVSFILIFIGALGDFAFYSIAGPRSTYSLARLMQMSAYEFEEWNQSAVMALTIMLTSAFFTILVSLLIKPLAVKRGEVK